MAQEGNQASCAFSPKKMLDIATGTGDFAILAAQMLHPDQLIGQTSRKGMMEIGRQKVKQLGLENTISFEKGRLPQPLVPGRSFDNVTAAFGIRNFQNLDQGTEGNVPGTEKADISAS